MAQLAGVSVDYLNRLEQGRGAHPSESVLGALARSLRLSTVEHDHLFHLPAALRPDRAGSGPRCDPACCG